MLCSMDFTLEEPWKVFDDNRFKERERRYRLYAFPLVTVGDGDLFLEFLKAFHDIHLVTSGDILVIAPNVFLNHFWTPEEVIQELARPERGELRSKFAHRMTEATYRLARRI